MIRDVSSDLVGVRSELKLERRLRIIAQLLLCSTVELVEAQVEGDQSGVLTFKALAITIPPFLLTVIFPSVRLVRTVSPDLVGALRAEG